MQNQHSSPPAIYPYQITITDLKGEHCFSSADIIRMQAADNYTIFYFTRHRPFIVSRVLKTYEEMLRPYGFLRTHRSHLVNLQFVKSVQQNHVIMQDASVAGITKRKKRWVVKQLCLVDTQPPHSSKMGKP